MRESMGSRDMVLACQCLRSLHLDMCAFKCLSWYDENSQPRIPISSLSVEQFVELTKMKKTKYSLRSVEDAVVAILLRRKWDERRKRSLAG
jgi:hypothetical protein